MMMILGTRPGETTGLPWHNLELDVGLVHILQSLKCDPNERGTNRLYIDDLKPSSHNLRTVAIPDRLITMLKCHRDQQSKDERRAGPHWKGNPDNLVFTTRVGTPVDPARLRDVVLEIARAAGIDKNVVPYDGRRSSISMLAEAGVDPLRIADLAGHDPRTTLGVYRRRMRQVVDAHLDAMNSYFGGTPEETSDEGDEPHPDNGSVQRRRFGSAGGVGL